MKSNKKSTTNKDHSKSGKKPSNKSHNKKNKKENFKVIVDLKKSNSTNLKKVLEDTAKQAKRLRQLRDKRRAQKGLPPLAESAPVQTENQKIWFEVDKVFLPEKNEPINQNTTTVTDAKITKVVAMDCEMVGVGEAGKDSILARLIQKEVAELIDGKTLVGHALHNDLQVLLLSHPKKKLRDTQKCKLFRQKFPTLGSLSSLKKLAQTLLGISIQDGEHNSVQDAQAAMRIYTTFKKEWEQFLRDRKSGKIISKKEGTEMATQKIELGTQLDDIKIKGNESHKKYWFKAPHIKPYLNHI
ncbi:RNA exonuclease 4 [Brachionus plicatilis]|uniref:RNA exonuclease 4 n=1 Tax=Brachionus plicatilis TaxID=10195 RepID=A0A3M7RG49_BRAPC|nr:RNA exonuclease 4 [Brachionus plicatilis]